MKQSIIPTHFQNKMMNTNHLQNIMKTVVFLIAAFLLLSSSQAKSLISEGQGDAPPKMPVYLGIGYNLITGNPLGKSVDTGFGHSIFRVTYNKAETTSDNRYLVPDGVSNRIVSSCSFDTAVNEHRGTSSYTKSIMDKISTKEGMSTTTFEAAFSKSRTTEVIYQSTILDKMSITHATAECEAYYLSVDLFKGFLLEDNFQSAVNKSFHDNNWQNFIQEYGTHFVYDVTMGGRAVQQIEYSFESVSQLSALDIDISTAARARFAMFFGDKEWDWHEHAEQINYTQIYSNDTKEFYLGGRPPRDGSILTWVENVVSNPMPIRYSVMELTELFDKITILNVKSNLAKVKASFVSALSVYCTKMGCKKPTPDLPKPPPSTLEIMEHPAVGSDVGIPFSFVLPTPLTVVKQVWVRCGVWVDGMQLVMSDGVKSTYSPAYGGQGGAYWIFEVPPNEYISQVEYWYGSFIYGFVLITNTGKKSPFYGSGGGIYAITTLPDDYRIIGFHGKFGDYINKFGFMLGKNIYPNSSDPHAQPKVDIKTIQLSTQ